MSHGRRHQGMTDKVARALGFGKESKYGPETAPCPERCGANLIIDTVRETGQMCESCPRCGYTKVHRGHLTTE